ncbi:MAG TPA: hypothetical protein VF469_09450 [Kofleriaceae bacterium]
MKLVAFCEAPSDFRLAAGLVDLVLRESGLAWVIDNLDTPEVIRTWQSDGSGCAYFDLHNLDRYTVKLGIRSVRGHFNGRPGGFGSTTARKAFLIARALHKRTPSEPIDAVVLLWDTDHQADERRLAVSVARDEARQWAPFQIVCGFPDPEREAWVLAGFDPCDDIERQRLDELHRDLGFSPVHHAIRLRDKDPGALRDIKRVLTVLTGEDPDREARCWIEPSLATLRERGAATGLSTFLNDLEAVLPALLGVGSPRT